MLTIGVSSLAGLFASMVASAATEMHPFVRRILESGFFRFLGKYSYAMYVLHPFVMGWMNSWFQGMIESTGWWSTGLPRFFIFTLLGLGFTSIAALLSWNLLERWFLEIETTLRKAAKMTLHSEGVTREWGALVELEGGAEFT